MIIRRLGWAHPDCILRSGWLSWATFPRMHMQWRPKVNLRYHFLETIYLHFGGKISVIKQTMSGWRESLINLPVSTLPALGLCVNRFWGWGSGLHASNKNFNNWALPATPYIPSMEAFSTILGHFSILQLAMWTEPKPSTAWLDQ